SPGKVSGADPNGDAESVVGAAFDCGGASPGNTLGEIPKGDVCCSGVMPGGVCKPEAAWSGTVPGGTSAWTHHPAKSASGLKATHQRRVRRIAPRRCERRVNPPPPSLLLRRAYN